MLRTVVVEYSIGWTNGFKARDLMTHLVREDFTIQQAMCPVDGSLVAVQWPGNEDPPAHPVGVCVPNGGEWQIREARPAVADEPAVLLAWAVAGDVLLGLFFGTPIAEVGFRGLADGGPDHARDAYGELLTERRPMSQVVALAQRECRDGGHAGGREVVREHTLERPTRRMAEYIAEAVEIVRHSE